MRAQRPATLATAVDATEQLPFPDGSFDAAMTTSSVHQWAGLAAGLAELRRVTRGPIAILTGDPARLRRFWLDEYAPEVLDAASPPTCAAISTTAPGTPATGTCAPNRPSTAR